MPAPQAAPTKRLTIDLPRDVHRRFKAEAAENEVTMVDLVRWFIDDLLADSSRLERVAQMAQVAAAARGGER